MDSTAERCGERSEDRRQDFEIERSLFWPDFHRVSELTEEQQGEMVKATSGKVGILTGVPGAGKSFSIARSLKHMPLSRIMACTPTGRAAVVLSDYFAEHGVPLVARTIHGTLIPQRNGHDGDGWSFAYNKNNRLPCDLLIVDEFSMCEASLFRQLLDAVPDHGRVLLVGDQNQLPPVGSGKPMIDLINSDRVPHGHLGTAHRYAGRIADVCGKIHRNEVWHPSPELNLEADYPENYRHIERPLWNQQTETLLGIVDRMRSKYSYDPIEDMQVVTTKNERSPMSRRTLNVVLQRHLNPDGRTVEKCDFRVGDKIICLKNGNRQFCEDPEFEPPSVRDDDNPLVYVANGETGRVLEINKKVAAFDFGRGKTIWVPRAGWFEFDLGYAITTHKSQGGGWPVVIAAIDDSGGARYLADRSLWYTALSRAKTALFTIGRLDELRRQCRKVKVRDRRTHLKEKLQEAFS